MTREPVTRVYLNEEKVQIEDDLKQIINSHPLSALTECVGSHCEMKKMPVPGEQRLFPFLQDLYLLRGRKEKDFHFFIITVHFFKCVPRRYVARYIAFTRYFGCQSFHLALNYYMLGQDSEGYFDRNQGMYPTKIIDLEMPQRGYNFQFLTHRYDQVDRNFFKE